MTTKSECIHFFILPPPDGKESLGVCKRCGLEQLHYNSMDHKFNSWMHSAKKVKPASPNSYTKKRGRPKKK